MTLSPGSPLRPRPRSRTSPGSPLAEPPLLLNATMADAGTDGGEQIHRSLRGYLHGQLAGACSFGIWWALSSPIYLAIFDEPLGIGLARLLYNSALLLASPLAGQLVEQSRVRSLLLYTTLGRAVLYAVALPAAWFLLRTPCLPLHAWEGSQTLLRVLVLVLLFVEGLGTAVANVLGVDAGGVDLVASEAGATVTDRLRNSFNAHFQFACDVGMLLAAPAVAFATLYGGAAIQVGEEGSGEAAASGCPTLVADAADAEILALIAGLGASLATLALLAVCFYCAALPCRSLTRESRGVSAVSASPPTRSVTSMAAAAASTPSAFTTFAVLEPSPRCGGCRRVLAGVGGTLQAALADAALLWHHRALFWRAVFLSVESALEDAMVALVLPVVCAHLLNPLAHAEAEGDADGGTEAAAPPPVGAITLTSVQTSLTVAAGKLGAVVGGSLMAASSYPEPLDDQAPHWLFAVSCAGGASALGVPAVVRLFPPINVTSTAEGVNASTTAEGIGPDVASALLTPTMAGLCACSFVFFGLTTVPKIGFATLLQSLAAQADASGRVFGFVGVLIIAADAAVMLALSALFSALPLRVALWTSCGFFAAVGILEGGFGRVLVLSHLKNRRDRTASDTTGDTW